MNEETTKWKSENSIKTSYYKKKYEKQDFFSSSIMLKGDENRPSKFVFPIGDFSENEEECKKLSCEKYICNSYLHYDLIFLNVYNTFVFQVCSPYYDSITQSYCRDPFEDDDDEIFDGRSRRFHYGSSFGLEFSHTSGSDPETDYVPFSENGKGKRELRKRNKNKIKAKNLRRTCADLFSTKSTQTKPKNLKMINKETNENVKKSFNALRQCFCTLKFSRNFVRRNVESCSSETVRSKDRSSSFHRRRKRDCVPGICTPYECLPEKCYEIAKKRRAKQNQYKKRRVDHNKDRTTKLIQVSPEICDCVRTLPTFNIKDYENCYRPYYQKQQYRQRDTGSILKVIKSVSNGVNVMKRCICTLKLNEQKPIKMKRSKSDHTKNKPNNEPKIKKSLSESSINKSIKGQESHQSSKLSEKDKTIKVVKDHARKHRSERPHHVHQQNALEEGECQPGTCIPYECNPIECLSEIERWELYSEKQRRKKKRRRSCWDDLEEGECQPGICDPDQCNPDDCIREIERRELCLKKYARKHKRRRRCRDDLEEGECEPGICDPDVCNPPDCFIEIQLREPCSETTVGKPKPKTRQTKSAITKVSKPPKTPKPPRPPKPPKPPKEPRPPRPSKPPKEPRPPKPSKPPKPPKEPRPSKPSKLPKPPQEPRPPKPSKPPKPPKEPKPPIEQKPSKPPKPPPPIVVKCKCIPKVKKVVSQDSFEEVIVKKKKKKGKKRVHTITVYLSVTEPFRSLNANNSLNKTTIGYQSDNIKQQCCSKSSFTISETSEQEDRRNYSNAFCNRHFVQLHAVKANHKLPD